jgi:hypothetical protein
MAVRAGGVNSVAAQIGEELSQFSGQPKHFCGFVLLVQHNFLVREPIGVKAQDTVHDFGKPYYRWSSGISIEAERLPDNMRYPSEFAIGERQIVPYGFTALRVASSQPHQVCYSFQRIIDFMRDCRRHAANGSQFLAADECLLREPQFGDVLREKG